MTHICMKLTGSTETKPDFLLLGVSAGVDSMLTRSFQRILLHIHPTVDRGIPFSVCLLCKVAPAYRPNFHEASWQMPTNAEFDLVWCAKLAWLGVSQQVQVAERLAGASFWASSGGLSALPFCSSSIPALSPFPGTWTNRVLGLKAIHLSAAAGTLPAPRSARARPAPSCLRVSPWKMTPELVCQCQQCTTSEEWTDSCASGVGSEAKSGGRVKYRQIFYPY